MAGCLLASGAYVLLIGSLAAPWALAATSRGRQVRDQGAEPIPLRPATLAADIDSLAGLSVRLTSARVVGVFGRQVFLVESDTPLRPLRGSRRRVLVFIESRSLRVPPALLVGSTVTLAGTARTLLSMQVSEEVGWPAKLTRDSVSRLDIQAALLATSVSTPEGVDLLTARQ